MVVSFYIGQNSGHSSSSVIGDGFGVRFEVAVDGEKNEIGYRSSPAPTFHSQHDGTLSGNTLSLGTTPFSHLP